MGMTLLIALLVQPWFEKDPWDGCKEGSWVKVKATKRIGTDEYTIQYVGTEEGYRAFERDPAIEDWEGAAVAFTGYVAALRAGYKKSEKK